MKLIPSLFIRKFNQLQNRLDMNYFLVVVSIALTSGQVIPCPLCQRENSPICAQLTPGSVPVTLENKCIMEVLNCESSGPRALKKFK